MTGGGEAAVELPADRDCRRRRFRAWRFRGVAENPPEVDADALGLVAGRVRTSESSGS